MKAIFYFMCVLSCGMMLSCRNKGPLLRMMSASHSGVHFNNIIRENDSINPFDVPNMYNGAGVGIGDFNRDGLQDIFFAGNQVSNRLYVNKGNFVFSDVTDIANVSGSGRWCRGVAVVDINNDGWPDVYVCTTILGDSTKRENLLYVNHGVNVNGVPVFTEMAKEYGLNDNSYSTMASFFDFDNDGDLDVYITVNFVDQELNPSVYRPKVTDGSSPSTGRLYRNDWNSKLGHAVFTNVSKKAGITIEGYGHSTTIADINRDGWKDIFVANDFLSNDLLYINNHDGTFTDEASQYYKHTSANGMGQDVIDIDNDGLSDVIEMDMDPEDNFRKKLLLSGYNYQNYQNNDSFGYQYQYVRNSLQLNLGGRPLANDSLGAPIFADVGYQAGISSTDWSWAPVVQDFDNDGFRDLIVTNGFPKDLTDHDFIAFREKSFGFASKHDVLNKIPQAKLSNYAFKNSRRAHFSDVTKTWGMTTPSFSNGAAYADLDNDGDLDVVISNINDEAFIYRNEASSHENSHYLSVTLVGDSVNRGGFGSWVEIYYGKDHQSLEVTPYRGYLSSMQVAPFFGLGKTMTIDSVIVRWPDRRRQLFKTVPADETLIADHKNAHAADEVSPVPRSSDAWFKDVSDSATLYFRHSQSDFIDFNIQKLLPHKLSEYGPGMATGDINGDGLDDICVSGQDTGGIVALVQQKSGRFIRRMLSGDRGPQQKMGLTLVDADNDGDPDLIVTGGGYEEQPNTAQYQDKLYINDGRGNFEPDSLALPKNTTSKSCVRAFDYDHDGDLDLFIAGRVYPWNYPKPVSSFIYRNDSKNGKIVYTEVTRSIAPALANIGMVCDAICTDFDNDGWTDLILAGEWMPVTLFKNDHGRFNNVTSGSGIAKEGGLWNSITAGDFDNDGDMDYIIGNLGQNSFYKASDSFPISIYARDFYSQGTTQCVLTSFLSDRQGGERKEFPTDVRDDVVEQLPFLKKRFLTYKDFGRATFAQLFTSDELKGALKYSATNLNSAFVRNTGGGHFELEPLPSLAQSSAINGMVVEDFDGDGNLDLCAATNDFGTQPSVGRYDALDGLALRGDGHGHFSFLMPQESGIFVPGNGRAMGALRGAAGQYFLAATQNKDVLKCFALKENRKTASLQHLEVSATIKFRDGRTQRREIGYGSSFLSQSARFLLLTDKISSIEFGTEAGSRRTVKF